MNRSGQSLIDVLIASALGALLLVGALSLLAPSLKGSASAERAQDMASSARGLMDSVRSLAGNNWSALSSLTRGAQYYLQYSATSSTPVAGVETVGQVGQNLTSWFTFDDTNTATLSNSVSGGPAGTGVGSPTATTTCMTNACWSFNGSSYATVPDNTALNPTSSMTMAGWFYLRSYGSIPFGKDLQYRLLAGDVNTTKLAIRYATSNQAWATGTLTGSSTLPLNTWFHAAATYDGSAWRVYLNGVEDGYRAETGTLAGSVGSAVYIGSYNGSSYMLDGKVDDIRVYSRALSPVEIQQLYGSSTLSGNAINRSFSIANVQRNSSGVMVTSGGTVDSSTLAVTVSFSGPGVATRTMSTFVARSTPAQAMYQTDWSGGSGLGTTTSLGAQFSSSTAIDYLTTTGSMAADLNNLLSTGGGGNGSISSTTADHFAWNDVVGWINFYSSGTVQLTSSRLKGYANSIAGEISLDCATSPSGNICGSSNYHVDNNGSGTLSGFAWNDTYGWISFNCSNNGGCGTSNYSVTVNPSTGVFSGFAWNDTIGWISFNGADIGIPTYRVVAAWSATPGYGILDSGIYDTTSASGAQVDGLTWTGSKPSGTDVRFQIATSNSSGGPWSYVGSDGTPASYYTPDSGVGAALYPWNHAAGRYIRYRVYLYSDTSQTVSPRIDDIVVRWSP